MYLNTKMQTSQELRRFMNNYTISKLLVPKVNLFYVNLSLFISRYKELT